MPDTRFRDTRIIEENQNKVPEYYYDVDQFCWYSDIMGRTIKDKSEIKNIEKLLSGVRFHLPFIAGEEAPSYLVLASEGLTIREVYLAHINWGFESFSAQRSKAKTDFRRLFSYGKQDSDRIDEKEYEQVERKLPMTLGKIFMTDIMPFLKGNFPLNCDRVYDFSFSMGTDRLRVIAENRKEREKEALRVLSFVDKGRDSEWQQIILLKHDYNLGRWWSEKLEEISTTDKFTFPSVVNA